ncbi:BZ3500_MvSof-1268-A1-R1_Chr4-2g06969 [Microbotryum saponariae]|uniref:BZ3500_MvSof-1268-A1-R1_Chr4-2g06969 protein n=1 Tax=Microbotryum saponariae TaxID=289078 RepID=A0A2X0KXB3_9BASI|nr:BZ3500_MvSof-1268-A1-R1_Chr4-2g06969 [Microbotryum saponariae]SDA06634.1 BZ3501_MvSof-1269-A2-R1_Chr4-2g06680 [Microbotryum saponariae]
MTRPNADSSAKVSPIPVDLGSAPATSSDEGDWSDWSPSEHSTEGDDLHDEASFDLVQSHEWSEGIDHRPAFLTKTHINRQVGGHRSERSRTPSHDGSSVAASASGDERMRLSFPDPLHASSEASIAFDAPSEGSSASLVGQDSDGDAEDEHGVPGTTSRPNSEVEYSFLLDAKEDMPFDTKSEPIKVDSAPPVSDVPQQVDGPVAADASSPSSSSGPPSGCAIAQWVQSTVQASQSSSPTPLDQDEKFNFDHLDSSRPRTPSEVHTLPATTASVDGDTPRNVKDETKLVDVDGANSKHEIMFSTSQERPLSNESPSDSQASLRSVDSNMTILASSPSNRTKSPAVLGSPIGLRKRSTQQASLPSSSKEPSTSTTSAVPTSSSLTTAAASQANAQESQATNTNPSEAPSPEDCAEIEYFDLSKKRVCRDTSTQFWIRSTSALVVLSVIIVGLGCGFLPARHGNLAMMDQGVVSNSSSQSRPISGSSSHPASGHGEAGSKLEPALAVTPTILDQVDVASTPIAPVQRAADVDPVATMKAPVARRPSSRQSHASAYRMVRPFKGQVEEVIPRSESVRDERCHCQCSKDYGESTTGEQDDFWSQPSDSNPLAAFKALVDAAQAQASTLAKYASETALRESKKRIKKLGQDADRQAKKLARDFDHMARRAAHLNGHARRQSVKMGKSLHHLFHRTGERSHLRNADYARIKKHMVKLEHRMKQAIKLLPDRSEQIRREGKKAAEVVTRRVLEAKWMVESWRNGEIDLLRVREDGFKVKQCDAHGVKDEKECKARRKMAKERGGKGKAPGRKRRGLWR